MGRYELLFIVRSGMGRDELKTVVKKVAKLIFERNGSIRKINTFGERVLPFVMRRHKEKISDGQYMLVDFICEPTRANEVNRFIYLEPAIYRHGMVRTVDPFERNMSRDMLMKKLEEQSDDVQPIEDITEKSELPSTPV